MANHQKPTSTARHRIVSLATILAILAVLAPGLFSQATDGNIIGSVIDPTGAAVPNATLTLDSTGTGVRASATTSNAGDYRFNNLPVGLYSLTAAAPGFSTVTLKNLRVELNTTATANLNMQVGSVSTSVEVSD